MGCRDVGVYGRSLLYGVMNVGKASTVGGYGCREGLYYRRFRDVGNVSNIGSLGIKGSLLL